MRHLPRCAAAAALVADDAASAESACCLMLTEAPEFSPRTAFARSHCHFADAYIASPLIYTLPLFAAAADSCAASLCYYDAAAALRRYDGAGPPRAFAAIFAFCYAYAACCLR